MSKLGNFFLIILYIKNLTVFVEFSTKTKKFVENLVFSIDPVLISF